MARIEEMEEWMRVLMPGTRPMTDEEYKASGLKEISSSSSPVEPEYVFDDGSNPFDDDSHK